MEARSHSVVAIPRLFAEFAITALVVTTRFINLAMPDFSDINWSFACAAAVLNGSTVVIRAAGYWATADEAPKVMPLA